MIETVVLASGSNGNALYVETRSACFLVDAGISARKIQNRLAMFGRDARSIDGILVTHEHLDHTAGVGAFSRRFRTPVFANRGTREAAREFRGVRTVETLDSGDTLRMKGASIRSVPVPHDAASAVGFVIEEDDVALGVFTDLGSVPTELETMIASLDILILETNHDPARLASSRYPAELRARIAGTHGHLSNLQAATLVASHATERLRVVFCAHLSAENNDPELALGTMRQALAQSPRLRHARALPTSRVGCSPWVRVDRAVRPAPGP